MVKYITTGLYAMCTTAAKEVVSEWTTGEEKTLCTEQ